MAITITSQPSTDKFSSSEYPLVIKATSNNASIKFIKFTITDTATTGLGIPSYYAPKINNEFTFNVSDYINSHLSIIRDDLVSFDATPSIHVYTNLTQDVQIDMREIETDGTVSAQAQSNDFFMCKFKHQLYNGNGTAEEYIDNRYFLTTLPYFRENSLGDPALFYLNDGRQTVNMLTDYSRVCLFNRHDAGISSDLTVVAKGVNGLTIATAIIDLASSFVSQEEVIGIPVNIDDVGALSTASGQSGWLLGNGSPALTSFIKSNYNKIIATIGDTPDQSTATIEFLNPSLFGKCPKTFIYMNRFGVHEVLTLNTKTNESVVSSRDNATLVNTDPFGAYTDDLGAYLLTGARQRAINPKSEFEFTVNNNLPYPKEQAREIALDFFASPVHYCVDVATAYHVFNVTHPDTANERIRRITINDGKVDVLKNDKVQRLSFSYRYADV